MADTENTSNVMKTFNAVSLYVVKQMARCNIEEGRTYVKERFYVSYDFSFIIRVTGKYTGAVIMSLEEKTALFLASAMVRSQHVKQFDKLAESAIQELANMTISRALLAIAGNELFNITPPEFIRSGKISLIGEEMQKTFVTELKTPGGIIEFNISLFNGPGDFISDLETNQK